MSNFTRYFDYPWLLALALALPLLALLLLHRGYRRRQKRLERFGELDVVLRLVPPASLARPWWRAARFALASCLVGVAVAGPRWGEERNVVRTRGIDMVLALDASLSMTAPDVRPSRLEQMKEEVRRLRAMSTGDRVGLIAFAGRSYILTPLTVDEGALSLFLDNLDPSVVGQAGSSLARAIRQGTDLLLLTNDGADRALVVMSDGEAFEPVQDVTSEAKRAGEQGISVVAVGFGTLQGSTIPVKNPDGSTTLKRDEAGQIVITKYTPEMLKAVADASHGTFIDAAATDKAARIKAALATLRTQQRATLSGGTMTPRFQLFLLPALLLLLLDTALAERRGRRHRRNAAADTAAVAASILLLISVAGCTRVTENQLGARAYHGGQFSAAAMHYRRAIDSGDRDSVTLYDYGTALVAGDSLQGAAEVLDKLADAKNPELRYRSLFNLGLAHLKGGLGAAAPDVEALDAALSVYKKVLLDRPPDMDAKWNYELALQKKKSGGGGGGGAGGGGGQSQSNANSQSPETQSPRPSGGLGQRQAEQLLGSAAREERDVQAKRQKLSKQEPPPGGKDW